MRRGFGWSAWALGLCLESCAGQAVERRADGPRLETAPDGDLAYLGQRRPGNTPEIFGRGIVSTGMYERDLAVSADGHELYFGLAFGQYVTILWTRLEEGRWTEPQVAPFAQGLQFLTLEPCLSHDGQRLYFLSTRPPPGQAPKPEWGHQNIWVVERTPGGVWGEPRILGPEVNTQDGEFYPSLTRDGTLYFTRSKAGGAESAVYRSRSIAGAFKPAERLPEPVNGRGEIFNAFIDPEERFLIACLTADPAGRPNYVVFFRDAQDRWSAPVALGPAINTPGSAAISASLSPDGRFLFFASNRITAALGGTEITRDQIERFWRAPENGSYDIYWVDAGFLSNLRRQAAWQ